MFLAYCTILVAALAAANYQGYVYTGLFSGEGHADRAANHYHK